MNDVSLSRLIANNSYGVYNKNIARAIGLEEAIILGELASEYEYWLKQNALTEDGYFFSTIENIEENTSIAEYRQRKALNKLKELGLIDIKVRGLPAKRYIKLNEDAIEDFIYNKLCKKFRTSSVISQELDTEKVKSNNNNIKIINNNNNLLDTLVRF